MKRILSFMTVLALLLVMCPISTQAAVPADFKGLVLTAPADVTVTLYTGFSDGSVVKPSYTEEGETTAYYYSSSSLTEKYYRFVSSGTGYYKLTQNIYMTSAKRNTKTVMDADPGKRAGNGWEPSSVVGYTAESTALALAGTAEDWPEYADVFTTPAFTPGRATHQMTTQAEMEGYIKALDDANDNMYIYSIGKSAGGLDIPIVVFSATDLSDADDLDAAAKAMDKSKTTILMRSHVHGNEPAAGEAALSIIRRLDQNGADILSKINFCIIPRANPDGAYKFRRLLNNDVDPNRDFMRATSVETVAFLKAQRTLAPEVFLDGHEYAMNSASSVLAPGDIMSSMGFTNRNSDQFIRTGMEMMQDVFAAMEENGLSYRYYNNEINGNNGNISRTYSAHQGTLFILMESRGINYGLSGFHRRVVSHVIATEALIDYVAEHADEIKQIITSEKAAIVSAGATYEENDQLILSTGYVEDTSLTITGTRVGQTGSIKEIDYIPKVFNVAERTRPAPTAYVIPAGQNYTQKVLDLMDKQGISYSFLAPGSAVLLQQYTGDVTEAGLTEESLVSFPDGAYVFYMNQERGITLAMLMEPDVTDLNSEKGTLAQQGILTPTNGVFPIYRYIHDLNDNGTLDFGEAPSAPSGLGINNPGKPGQTGSITGLNELYAYEYRAENETSYTKLPLGTTAITGLTPETYYIRFQATDTSRPSADTVVTLRYTDLSECVIYLNSSAPAGGNGYTKENAVNTIEEAYSQLSKLMADAPENASGKIVIVGTYTLLAAPTVLPAHTYPVTITGAAPSDGLDYATTESTQALRQIQFNGPTTLENMTLTYSSSQSLSYLCAQGHPFTVGSNVNTVPNKRSVYLSIIGGYYDSGNAAASTDLTVLSGIWFNIYANGYYGKLTGDAKLTVNGGQVIHNIQIGYGGATGGNVTLSIANTSGNALYCGNAKRGDLSGDISLTLGENVTIPTICAGSRDEGNLTGTVTVIMDGADLSASTLSGECENTAGKGSSVNKSVLVLKSGKVGSFSSFDAIRLDTSAGGTVQTASDLTVDAVVGGGNLQLDKDNLLTITNNVSGVTGISVIDGTVGKAYVTAPASVASGSFVYTGDGKLTKRDTSWYLEALPSPAAAVQVAAVTYQTETLQEAFQAAGTQPVITLLKDSTGDITAGKNVTLDLNGYNLNGTLQAAAGITVSCMDSKTADYNISDGKYGKLKATGGTGTITGLPASEDQDAYLTLRDSEGISFHAVRLDISSMTLRPSTAGLYFTADFQADAQVKAQVRSFGVAMSVEGAPGALVAGQYTSFEGSQFGTATSSILNGVLKATNNLRNNQRNAELPVYARAYIQLDSGECLFGFTLERSLLQQILLIDKDWQTYGNQEILNMYKAYQDVMGAWDIPNLKAAAS